ncbi:MAG: 50S ribosomal protein L4 [Verrucomicrobia bacterium]|nr:50S ribosomal protein L4 [Verrucomicrobiota bacterium]MBS0635952.1 50S ribosomal protein L4 [Verrucomicrobiota bacterium]
MRLPKVNLKGEEVGKVDVSEELSHAEANSQMIKDYLVALRANARQWNANTKGRSDVNHSTKKPHAQKGTGNARQGSLAATQYKGGGRPFGPKTKYDQHVRINKKERRAAIRALLADKIQANQFFILETPEMSVPKTRDIQNFMDKHSLIGKTLFLAEASFVDVSIDDITQRFMIPTDKHDVFARSIRNIPNACFKLVSTLSGYDVILANHIVITEAGYKELQDWLVKG